MESRIYRREEIQELLERAVELQAASPSEAHSEGLTLQELVEVAKASGIDPLYLRRAAAEMDHPVKELPSSTNTHVFADRFVEGELTEEAWQEVVIEMRRRFGTSLEDGNDEAPHRKEGQQGLTRSLTHVDADEEIETQVHLIPRDDGVHIRLSQRFDSEGPIVDSLIISAILTVVVGTLVTTLVDGVLLDIAAYAVTFILSFLGVYALDSSWRRTKQRELDMLGDMIAQIVQTEVLSRAPTTTAAGRAGTERKAHQPSPALDLEKLSSPDQQEREAGQSYRRQSDHIS